MSCSRCGGTGLIETYRINNGAIEKETMPCNHQMESMSQPASDGTTHLGNLRVLVWELEHWPFFGDGMTNPSMTIANLDIEIRACEEMGTNICNEIGATPDKLRELATLVQEEHRQRYGRVIGDYKERESQARAA